MRPNLIIAGIATLCLAGAVLAQPSASSPLVVHVAPEAHLNLAQIALNFRVSADGTSDVTSQAVASMPITAMRTTREIDSSVKLSSRSGDQKSQRSLLDWKACENGAQP